MYINVEHGIRRAFETLERNGLKIATYGDNVPSSGPKLTIGEHHVNAAWVVGWIEALPPHQSLTLRLKYGCDAEMHREVAQLLAPYIVMECGRAEINKAQVFYILSMWARNAGTPGAYMDAFDVCNKTATRHIKRVKEIAERWKAEGIAALYPRFEKIFEENA